MSSDSPETGTSSSRSEESKTAREAALTAGLRRLVSDRPRPASRLVTRLRNYFLTGLIIVGPISITIYLIWTLIQFADAWVKPLIPSAYLPETYLPFAIPGIGLFFAIAGVTLIGALTANLLGRTLVSIGELMLDRMPIVRNVYRALKQIFESVVSVTAPQPAFQKVGLIQFPSKGLWSLVFVTGETGGEIKAVEPDGQKDLLSVFMPTGIVPPTGFICFVPRREVTMLNMTIEDAAKIILSAGMVTPDYEARLKALAEAEGLVVPGKRKKD